MPTTYTIPDGELFFNATTYTGNGGTQTITNGVPGQSFQPDFVWIKGRNAAWAHRLADAVRGVGKELFSNDTSAELTNNSGGYLTAFNSNGFSINSGAGVNTNNDTYVAWQWKANGAGSSNTQGSITSTVSANTTAGFSIVTYTGNGSNGASIGHGLGTTPAMVILKARSTTSNWVVYHQAISSPTNNYLNLNTTDAVAAASGFCTPNSSTITFTTAYSGNNPNGVTMVAYCWAQVAGYSAFGSYTGNGSTDGPFIYTGFRPRWIMIKRTDDTYSWWINDSARDPRNVVGQDLAANLSQAESSDAPVQDFLSNGFKLRTSAYPGFNANGGSYIYMAFAENPFKYANAR